jgi:hypothetical protein
MDHSKISISSTNKAHDTRSQYSNSLSSNASASLSSRHTLDGPETLQGNELPETIAEEMPSDPDIKAQIEADLALLAEDPPSENDDVEDDKHDEQPSENINAVETKDLVEDNPALSTTLSRVMVRERSGPREDVPIRARDSLDTGNSVSSNGSQDKSKIHRSSSKKRLSTHAGSDGGQPKQRKSIKKTKADFDFGELLGEGSYGKVSFSHSLIANP